MSDSAIPWIVAHQAPLSMKFSRQEYWSGLPFPSPRDLTNPGIKPGSPASQTDTLPSSHQGHPKISISSVQSLSRVRLLVTPWTVALQAPLSVGFSGQEYWSGLPFPPPEDLPGPGIKPGSPASQADSSPSEPQGSPLASHQCLLGDRVPQKRTLSRNK